MPHKTPSSDLDILNEPDWSRTHTHHIGTRSRDARHIGLTHPGDDRPQDYQEDLEGIAGAKLDELRGMVRRGELVNVRDILTRQMDFHLERPEVHPRFWRYVLHTTEGFIKEEQPWAVNLKKKEKEEERRREEGREQDGVDGVQKKQSKADGQGEGQKDGTGESEEKDRPKRSVEEEALLQCLRYEQEYRASMTTNNGKGYSHLQSEDLPRQIDEADQFSPDSWIPRSDKLTRLTGKHPLNAEVNLTNLFDGGLITPSSIHYVRNHGTVPHLLWENHKLEVIAGKRLLLGMNELKDQFESINIPIFLACDGNRRKELNMIKKTRAFNYTAAAAGCSYWRGVLLRDVLLAADVQQLAKSSPEKSFWVNYEGADQLSEGKYETCLPLDYALEPNNDVLLAYEMNDHPISPDHGYPLRLMLPGWVGARSVKWLSKIWITNHENNSYYYIYDNRQLPSFIEDPESEIAQIMYRHPSTICTTQMLNSVIVRPAQGESIDLGGLKKDEMYRVQGYAYSGSGSEIDRVEVSLDGGDRWLYCVRKYPEAPIRHGRKFWTWLHWHIDLPVSRFIRVKSILVRAFDEHKNTQPPKPVWNIEGMMNNCWYEVRPEIHDPPDTPSTSLLFRHPVDAGTSTDGWMKPSTSEQIESIKQKASAPEKQFTRQEVEKHNTESDCWIVVNGNVYEATSVLSWHPGGKGAIMAHAGAVHMDTTEEFESIHDNYAQDKLKECIIGKVTQKAMDHMKKEAEQKKAEASQTDKKGPEFALDKHKWTQATLTSKSRLSSDTQLYTFTLPPPAKGLGLSTGQHIQLGFHFEDRLVVRPYTPTRPILDIEDDGSFDLVVKTYFPDENQPGGTMSNILDCLREGEEVEVKGPSGGIRYFGHGRFEVDGDEHKFNNVTLILGGSGVTPGYQIIARILKTSTDETKIKVIDANKSENDILLASGLEYFSKNHADQFQVTHVLSHPSDNWKGLKGHVNEDIIKEHAFEPAEGNVALLCGPPTMIQKAALPALKAWGYDEYWNLFGF